MMNVLSPLTLLLFVSLPILSTGFLEGLSKLYQPAMQARPDLIDVIDHQSDAKLNIQLQIGNDQTGFLAAKDMVVELYHDKPTYDHVTLPGADGYYADCSSGHRSLKVLSKAHFINLDGMQYIDCEKGCWEVCWVKDKPAGTLVCAFRVPSDYKRNDAIIPEGNIWFSFPIWTASGLQLGQSEKKRVMDEIKINIEKRDEELAKFDNTDNPIKKAMYLRNAFLHAEKCSSLHHHTLDTIPENNQIIELQDNLLLATNGMIWRKNGDSHVLLGSATASVSSNKLMP